MQQVGIELCKYNTISRKVYNIKFKKWRIILRWIYVLRMRVWWKTLSIVFIGRLLCQRCWIFGFCCPGIVTSTSQVLWQALTYKCNAITVTCSDVYWIINEKSRDTLTLIAALRIINARTSQTRHDILFIV